MRSDGLIEAYIACYLDAAFLVKHTGEKKTARTLHSNAYNNRTNPNTGIGTDTTKKCCCWHDRKIFDVRDDRFKWI